MLAVHPRTEGPVAAGGERPVPPNGSPARSPKRSRSGLGYRPALDGVRALAVAAVFAYHVRLRWARAGFLGVDVFFVLSGYLITALLLGERRREGRIDLRRFWTRRARRLLPALVVVLAAVALAVPILAPEQGHRLRGDLLAALAYVSNWRLIFEHQSYFEAAGRPPLLQHLWSLAVEEQFYLLWPPILVVALRRRPYRRLLRPLLIAAAVSAGLMAVLFHPYSDPSRAYYGTDTRAAALLVGAALAAITTRWQLVDRVHRFTKVLLDLAGIVGLAGLVWCVSHVNEFDPRLYRGGFLAVAVLAAGLVAATARPGRPLLVGRVLGVRPLVWLGKRSYGVYLWFWPVLMLTRPSRDLPLTGLPLLALRIAVTLLLAALSYRFVEQPARAGVLGRVWRDAGRTWSLREPVGRRVAAWGLAFSVALTSIGIGVVFSHSSNRPSEVEVATGFNAALAAKLAASMAQASEPTTTTTAAPPPPVLVAPEASTTTTTTPAPPTTLPPLPTIAAKVTAVGDSVLLGAKPLLEAQVDGIVVDATVGRQFSAVLSAVKSYKDAGTLGDEVVIQTGNNGPFSAGQFDQLMDLLRNASKVVVVNVKVDRAWQDQNNDVMRAAVGRWPNAVLVDWHTIASSHPDAFYDDGLHLTANGIRLFVASVLKAL